MSKPKSFLLYIHHADPAKRGYYVMSGVFTSDRNNATVFTSEQAANAVIDREGWIASKATREGTTTAYTEEK